MITDTTACRVCSAPFRKSFSRQDTRYGICAKCGAISKILTKDGYEALGATYDPGEIFKSANEQLIRQHLMVDTKQTQLRRIAEWLGPRDGKPPITLLDIGCGMGGYLLAGRQLGFQISGIEPSQDHSAVGQTFFDLPIRNAYFDASDFKGQTFDIVILSHVIEHIFDPAEFMTAVGSVVSPNGILVVITPNAQSSLARLSGRNWSMLAPLDHVTMMTPKALYSLKPDGFAVSVTTAEIIWEPAVVLLQALRAKLRPNRVKAADSDAGAKTSNSFRGTIAMINGNPAVRLLLSVVSAPMWVANRLTGNAHCLTGRYRRTT